MNSMSKIMISALIAGGLMMASFSESRVLPDDPWLVRPLLTGAPAPAFTARSPDGQAWSFDPAELDGPVILTFYRGSWCPYCTQHLMDYRKVETDLVELGYRLVFVSPDRPEVIAEGLGEETTAYDIISDSRLAAAEAFGVAFHLDDVTVARYLKAGIDLEEAAGEDHHALPVPSTWIIGEDGTIRFSYVNPDYKTRLAPAVLLAAAQSVATSPGNEDR